MTWAMPQLGSGKTESSWICWLQDHGRHLEITLFAPLQMLIFEFAPLPRCHRFIPRDAGATTTQILAKICLGIEGRQVG
jgi:hypothetical protein